MLLTKIENLLLFLTVLFLPTQLGRHFWPEFSFVYSLPIDYLSPTLYFWDILVFLLCVAFVLQGKHINRLALNLLFFFLLAQSLSLLFKPINLGAGLVRLEQYLVSGLFGIYVASVKWKALNTMVFWPLALSILGESVLAILQFFKGGTLGFWILGERTFSISTPAIAKFDFQGIQFLRPYATFPHPNVLAGFLVIGTCVSWIMYPARGEARQRRHGSRWKRTLFALTMLLSSLATFLTVSRVAILAGVVVSMILLKGKWKMILLGVILLLSPVLFTRFSAVFNFDNLTILRREELSEVALRMFVSSPIFGAGLNNFIPEASDKLLVGPSRFLQPVHNIFLLSLAETGVLGVLGLLGLIGYPIWKIYRLSPKPYPLNPILLIWGTVIFLGLFDHYFLTLPQGYRMLFLLWGLSISMLKFKSENNNKNS